MAFDVFFNKDGSVNVKTVSVDRWEHGGVAPKPEGMRIWADETGKVFYEILPELSFFENARYPGYAIYREGSYE
ncbi:hypothetical protein [Magnetococcus marinus]|uniref:hypothetical protein n=1 Tax=Magnetococcus marinus TaxID=1124597 RepID=UPI0005A19FF8|nr:hypothetical protein [Magnetococcus marinus]